jgi:hypothetical protein
LIVRPPYSSSGSGWRTHGPSLLKTFATVNGTALRGLERNGGFFPTLRTGRLRFGSLEIRCLACVIRTFCLAGFAPLGFVLETLVGEKHLFAGGKHKLCTALRALQDLIPVLHLWLPRPHAGCEAAKHFGLMPGIIQT